MLLLSSNAFVHCVPKVHVSQPIYQSNVRHNRTFVHQFCTKLLMYIYLSTKFKKGFTFIMTNILLILAGLAVIIIVLYFALNGPKNERIKYAKDRNKALGAVILFAMGTLLVPIALPILLLLRGYLRYCRAFDIKPIMVNKFIIGLANLPERMWKAIIKGSETF